MLIESCLMITAGSYPSLFIEFADCTAFLLYISVLSMYYDIPMEL